MKFDTMDRMVKVMFGVAATFIALCFIAIIAFWFFAATVVVKAGDQVEQSGLKSVIENIWCGTNNKCL